MKFVRNAWYVAMWSQDLKPGELQARLLLNEPIVFFRKADGSIAALLDRCPHRLAALHMGRVCEGDRLRCAYHGLEFDASGACVRNPHGEGRIPPGMKVRSYPAVERHTLVWVWMGEGEADRAAIPDFSLLETSDPRYMSKRDYIKMEASYDLIVYNLLDLSHAATLHEGLLGTEDMLAGEVRIEQDGEVLTVRRWMPGVRTPDVYKVLLGSAPERVDAWADMRWHPASALLNDNGVCLPGSPRSEGTGLLGAHLLTPETPTTTHYHFCAVQQNPRPRATEADEITMRKQMSELRRMAFEQQDKPMIEGQQRNIDLAGGPEAVKPVLLSTDAGAVRCHRILEKLIRAEQGEAV